MAVNFNDKIKAVHDTGGFAAESERQAGDKEKLQLSLPSLGILFTISTHSWSDQSDRDK